MKIDLNYSNETLSINKNQGEFTYEYKDNLIGLIEILGRNNNEKCKMSVLFNVDNKEDHNMISDDSNDKFYFDFQGKIAIDDIINIEFTFT